MIAVDDDPGDTILSVEISGGADMQLFTVDSNNVLSLSFDPDHERPQDANGNNFYEVDITVTSQSSHGLPAKSTTVPLLVFVADVVEPPEQITDMRLVNEGLTSLTIDRGQAANTGPRHHPLRGPDIEAWHALCGPSPISG